LRFGNAVAADTAQSLLFAKNSFAPGKKMMFRDKIAWFEPVAARQYRHDVYLFGRYAIELVREFSLFRDGMVP